MNLGNAPRATGVFWLNTVLLVDSSFDNGPGSLDDTVVAWASTAAATAEGEET